MHGLYRAGPPTGVSVRVEYAHARSGECVIARSYRCYSASSSRCVPAPSSVSAFCLLVVVFPCLAAAAIGIRIVVRQMLVLARDNGRNVRYMLVLEPTLEPRASPTWSRAMPNWVWSS